eukprot:NODE_4661_length_456_cov_79.606880_g4020_i0.p1 GENE.NODE_4661_length_456_cov_79.606880_g4020_i0~~NODE_4661_length_456_cov_79.606880_g4020_i0.p1  ORF type:complete len:86 (+),score=2.71 NODE_4661_length_456_cov_79.606880_g4020_i0:43-300(+)
MEGLGGDAHDGHRMHTGCTQVRHKPNFSQSPTAIAARQQAACELVASLLQRAQPMRRGHVTGWINDPLCCSNFVGNREGTGESNN